MPKLTAYAKTAQYADRAQYYYNLASIGTHLNDRLEAAAKRSETLCDTDEPAEITASQSNALRSQNAIHEHIIKLAGGLQKKLKDMELVADKARQKQDEAGPIADYRREQEMLEVQRVRSGALDYLSATAQQASSNEKFLLQEIGKEGGIMRPSPTMPLPDMQAVMNLKQQQCTTDEVWSRAVHLFNDNASRTADGEHLRAQLESQDAAQRESRKLLEESERARKTLQDSLDQEKINHESTKRSKEQLQQTLQKYISPADLASKRAEWELAQTAAATKSKELHDEQLEAVNTRLSKAIGLLRSYVDRKGAQPLGQEDLEQFTAKIYSQFPSKVDVVKEFKLPDSALGWNMSYQYVDQCISITDTDPIQTLWLLTCCNADAPVMIILLMEQAFNVYEQKIEGLNDTQIKMLVSACGNMIVPAGKGKFLVSLAAARCLELALRFGAGFSNEILRSLLATLKQVVEGRNGWSVHKALVQWMDAVENGRPDIPSPIDIALNELPEPLIYHNPFGFEEDEWTNSKGRSIFVEDGMIFTFNDQNAQMNVYLEEDVRLSMPEAWCIQISFLEKRRLLDQEPEFEAPFVTCATIATSWLVKNLRGCINHLLEDE